MSRIETIGQATLYLGDCLEILPTLGRFDAAVTDPPYGIGESSKKNATRGRQTAKWGKSPRGSALAYSNDYGDGEWDNEPADPKIIEWLQANCRWQVIFGGNYYALPPTSCWLVWDKVNGTNDFADCELAWTNIPKAVRKIEWLWNGMCRKGGEQRFHLTQKPLGVMRWAIDQIPAPSASIIDPFMGSGTTGVAAAMAGKRFVGVERVEKYYDIACRRIEDASKRPDMFTAIEQRAEEIQQTIEFGERKEAAE